MIGGNYLSVCAMTLELSLEQQEQALTDDHDCIVKNLDPDDVMMLLMN